MDFLFLDLRIDFPRILLSVTADCMYHDPVYSISTKENLIISIHNAIDYKTRRT
jgi:hypothetical protein